MSWAETITIIETLKYNFIEVTEDTTVYIPAFVDNIIITACGGGGGGGGGINNTNRVAGGGGGGADCIYKKSFKVINREINITVGKGGAGGTRLQDGSPGTATVIDGYITLAGGLGGSKGSNNLDDNPVSGGAAGGSGGGNGGKGSRTNINPSYATAGEDGLVGKGGVCGDPEQSTGGGGGGGSLGNGGRGSAGVAGEPIAENGELGSGGGGGGASSATTTPNITKGGNGGDGYVKIEWSGLLY